MPLLLPGREAVWLFGLLIGGVVVVWLMFVQKDLVGTVSGRLGGLAAVDLVVLAATTAATTAAPRLGRRWDAVGG
jgi:hypothetical protein